MIDKRHKPSPVEHHQSSCVETTGISNKNGVPKTTTITNFPEIRQPDHNVNLPFSLHNHSSAQHTHLYRSDPSSQQRAAAMGSLTPSTPSSTITTASNATNTTASASSTSHQILEITLISAQDLTAISKSMRTYAVVWVHPDRKLTTRVDHGGNANPTWNDKFVFRIDAEMLNSESSAAVVVEIYTVSWFRDNLVGTVRVLINNLIPPFARNQSIFGTRFVALQVRRASGSPQGILNMGVSLVDSTMRSMPIFADLTGSRPVINGPNDKTDKKRDTNDENHRVNAKIQLWRSRSEKTDFTFEDDFPPKSGSICNGSIINGSVVNESELCSDVGPSASIVAAAIAKGLYPPAAAEQKVDDGGSSILEDLTMEEAKAKGYRSKACRADLPPVAVDQRWDAASESIHSRRHSDGGLFSCFAYGVEFTIVCGASTKSSHRNRTGVEKPIKRSRSQQNIIQ
ncbi:calcium-dependent lipid-binding (CaLB domain) family protein [Actinidia rufa]|uniref:Calcium-dependent lipid-binding (CaLB domain) family protein n=1 Tax=Actinidia rufa TaxID=165716 RepID=A0A7J0GQ82_9ERIC|nr:calcium-dependent lipid-binding (CaLB domain) family protein [Actinidia rufa]